MRHMQCDMRPEKQLVIELNISVIGPMRCEHRELYSRVEGKVAPVRTGELCFSANDTLVRGVTLFGEMRHVSNIEIGPKLLLTLVPR